MPAKCEESEERTHFYSVWSQRRSDCLRFVSVELFSLNWIRNVQPMKICVKSLCRLYSCADKWEINKTCHVYSFDVPLHHSVVKRDSVKMFGNTMKRQGNMYKLVWKDMFQRAWTLIKREREVVGGSMEEKLRSDRLM